MLAGNSIDEIKDMDFNIQPVGSGPYKFDRLIVEEVKSPVWCCCFCRLLWQPTLHRAAGFPLLPGFSFSLAGV